MVASIDVQALRAAMQNKQFHAKEQSLLKMIQQAEAIHVQQRNMLATARDLAEVFTLQVDAYKLEVTPFDTIANLAEQLAQHVDCVASSLAITKDGQVLPGEATLSLLGISASVALGVKYPAAKGKQKRRNGRSGAARPKKAAKVSEKAQPISHVCVKTLTGKTLRVAEIDGATTVDEVKQKILD
ncbi:unnamed protein product [Symbiodinium pilosum]|uniref:Ubiquitin-like domain-containing protein n=1 Tax=Symbiodinium pilosum TaxID=2952 RepID=A0A812S604_SYMPI|nr:unnamed protein product [Symbiodinium pilosum]